MLKIIFKNLWNRRRRNAWIAIELVLVTIISWVILDPAIVSISDSMQPLGYDADRIALFFFSKRGDCEPDSLTSEREFRAVLSKIRSMEEVAALTPVDPWGLPENQSISINEYCSKSDTAGTNTMEVSYWTGFDYFKTLGIEAASPATDIDAISSHLGRTERVISESLARRLFPDGSEPVGQKLKGYKDSLTVVGVVNDIRWQSWLRRSRCTFWNFNPALKFPLHEWVVAARLRDGENPDDFVSLCKSRLRHINTDNYSCTKATSYTDFISSTEEDAGISTERNKLFILASFFLINLVLGVVGSVYLSVQRRIGEIGIHRSYGATRRNIMTMLLGETAILTVLSFLAGDLLYLQYALSKGLSGGHDNNCIFEAGNLWNEVFETHFLLVSVIILAVLLICTLAGSYLPARSASRVNPVDSMRSNN